MVNNLAHLQKETAMKKSGVQKIIGKRIKGVVLKKLPNRPHSQLYLIFPDGTYFEFYTDGDQICATSAPYEGGLQEARGNQGKEHVVLEYHDDDIRESAILTALARFKAKLKTPFAKVRK